MPARKRRADRKRPTAGKRVTVRKPRTEATTTLHIKFVGLCLFARDPQPSLRGSKEHVHVLLVNHGDDSGGHGHDHQSDGHHAHPKHFARLLFFKQYLPDGPSEEDGLVFACKDLTRRVLLLGNPGDGALRSRFPQQLVSLQTIGGVGPLPRAYITGDALRMPNPPQARITLYSGNADPERGGLVWQNDCHPNIPEKRWQGPITSQVNWTIEGLPAGPLTIELRDMMDESRVAEQITLKPINGRVKVIIMNSPFEDLPPAKIEPRTVGACFKADHYEGFYSVFPNATKKIIPGTVSAHRNVMRPDAAIWTRKSDCKQGEPGGDSRATLTFSAAMKALARKTSPAPETCLHASTEVESKKG